MANASTRAIVTEVLASAPTAASTRAVVTEVLAAAPTAASTRAAVVEVLWPYTESAIVADITGAPGALATFDGSSSQNGEYRRWAWTSVPAGSTVSNGPVPLPDNAGTDGFVDMTDNAALFHMDTEVLTVTALPDNAVSSGFVDMTGNVLLWHFEVNADDSSGQGTNGTISGATQVAGHVGSYAYEFDGSNDYIEATGTDVLPGTTNAITISLWQYGDASQPRNDTIFEGSDSSGNRVIKCHLPWGDSNIYWDCGNSGTSSADRIYKTATSGDWEGGWNHWCFTKDVAAGEMKIYLNGALWHSGTGLTRTLSAITAFRLGGDTDGSYAYAGAVDELAVWARVLTADEIGAIYANQIAGTFPVDSSGEGRVLFPVSTTYETGKVGAQSLGLSTSTSEALIVPPVDLSGGSWTIAFWFYNLKANSTWRTGARGSVTDHQIIVESGGDTLGVFANGNGDFRSASFEMPSASYTGWHHIVAVGAGSTTTLYVDGAYAGVADRKSTDNIYSVGNVQNSGGSSGNQQFADRIDEVAVWQRALSADEIEAIYLLQYDATYAWIGTTFPFTPDIEGTYTVELSISGSESTTADAVIGVGGGPTGAFASPFASALASGFSLSLL